MFALLERGAVFPSSPAGEAAPFRSCELDPNNDRNLAALYSL